MPDPDILKNGVLFCSKKNIEVINQSCAQRHVQRFAGSDAERLIELNSIPELPPHAIVMALRGGYGMHRLLDEIDWLSIANQVDKGLKIVGHSDFTAFQMALLAKTGAVTYAGPMFSYDFCSEVSEFTWRHFESCMNNERMRYEVIQSQSIEKSLGVTEQDKSILWGGNLSMIASLIGTEYLPSVDQVKGGILFIEDVNEHPYRIERMLHQLWMAGYLSSQKAILIGDIASYKLTDTDCGYDLRSALNSLRIKLGSSVPILVGLPFGHCPDKLTIPIGKYATLSASSSGFILETI
jgi:muramoyltetrapeptide carboxypeptidase